MVLKILLVASLGMLVAVLAVTIAGCQFPEPLFHKGQVLRMKIDDRKVQVVSINCNGQTVPEGKTIDPCTYNVRFQTGIAYNTMTVREWELKVELPIISGGCYYVDNLGHEQGVPCELIK